MGTTLKVIDTPEVKCIVLRELVEDTVDTYPHFLVEEYADEELTREPPVAWMEQSQKAGEFDTFKVAPPGVELGSSRRVLVTTPYVSRGHTTTVKQPTPESVRVYLTTRGGMFDVMDAPLDEDHETVSHGLIRIVKVVHESFFIEAVGGDDVTIALMTRPDPTKLLEMPRSTSCTVVVGLFALGFGCDIAAALRAVMSLIIALIDPLNIVLILAYGHFVTWLFIRFFDVYGFAQYSQ